MMSAWFAKHVAFPLWEIKDGSQRRRYLRELSASQWWNPQQLLVQQEKRLREIVEYAYRHCPYYQRRFAESSFNGLLHDTQDFARLPLLTKQDIRAHGTELLSREFARESLIEARTGGSTGIALTVYFDTRCQEMRNAAAMRSDRWAGWDIGMKVAAAWGNPPVANTWKQKLRKLLLDRIFYLDTLSISDSSIDRFIADWRRERPDILYGHSHSIYILATYLRSKGVTDLHPRGIITTSMMLLEPERRVIEQVFGCRVTNRYGCEEVGLIACECEEHQGLHLNIDHLLVEFLREDGSPAKAGEEAHLVVTDLINRGMPLIRYQVGDMGVLSKHVCPCGRGLPLLECLTGRRADFLRRVDGSRVAGVSLVERTLTAIPGIEQMQLIQDSLHHICVKVVKDQSFNETSRRSLHRELAAVFGDGVNIDIRLVQALDQTGSGKYRFAICNIG